VDVRPIQTVSDLTPYRAVIVGGAIHTSAWMPEAVTFVETHRDTLSRVPVAYFVSCLTLALTNTDELRRKVAGFLEPVRQQVTEVQPVDVGLFAGKLDFSKLPYVYRVLWPFTAGGQVPEGDYRDWKTIKAWAGNLLPALLNA
jgi:menaquinone-dependent protoporphyrinogen oxidase